METEGGGEEGCGREKGGRERESETGVCGRKTEEIARRPARGKSPPTHIRHTETFYSSPTQIAFRPNNRRGVGRGAARKHFAQTSKSCSGGAGLIFNFQRGLRTDSRQTSARKLPAPIISGAFPARRESVKNIARRDAGASLIQRQRVGSARVG